MRGLILAFQFLTRLPMPQLADFEQEELTTSAIWFPLVGLVIGLLLIIAAQLGLHADSWIAALLVMLVWIGVTGALHLDGAADLADALGASHRDSERFLSVLKDPHIGTFGVTVLMALILSKLVSVAWMVESPDTSLWALLLIPVWARLGSIYWSQSLKSLAAGSGEQFAWRIPDNAVWLWGAALSLLSLITVSLLFVLIAIVSLLLWRAFLQWRLGGMSGDCLGAGIEYCECAMLLAVCLL
jgi:adenosylcobinamide-GDP ribazoletransferase